MLIEFAIQNALGILPNEARAEHALATFRRKIESIMLAVQIGAFAENCKLGRICS